MDDDLPIPSLMGLQLGPCCPGCGAMLPEDGPAPCPGCGLLPDAVMETEAAGAGLVSLSGDDPAAEAQALLDRVIACPGLVQRYELDRKLGQGGMGAIYSAKDRLLGRPVALKLMLGTTGPDRERFLREAQVLATLDHPNILRIHNIEVFEGVPVLVLELLQGRTLKADLERVGRFPVERARAIGLQILAGLEAAHRHGVVHRDLKSENVLLLGTGDDVKILDFGLARQVAGGAGVTQVGAILGTPAYMSPEQAQGQPADVRSDLYSLGVILFELLTGQLPFQGSFPMELLVKHLREEPPALSTLVGGVPSDVEHVVLRALAKQPGERYQDSVAFSQALRETTGYVAPAAPGPSAIAKPPVAMETVVPAGAPPQKQSGSATQQIVKAGPFQPPGAAPATGGAIDAETGFTDGFLAQYRMVRLLGRGGMGAVYLMRQVRLDRLVAIKVIKKGEVSDEHFRRFEREAKLLAGLNHAHVLGLYDIGRDGATPYMVMEYVEGETLAARMKRTPRMSLKEIIRVTRQVLSGLQAAHEKGIVHRDLKPDNIFLQRLRAGWLPKIGDFGLARSQNLPSGTIAGAVMGTPPYMSPEQCRGRDITPSCDLYAIGVMLFQMVTGKLPFAGPTSAEFMVQHTREPAPRARTLAPDLPEGLDALIARTLEKDPSQRPGTALELSKALQDIYRPLVAREPGRKRYRPQAGAVLADRYELTRAIGAGSMGEVWSATDRARGGEPVALKLLPPEVCRDAAARADLVREANVSLKLAHPGIVRLINLEPGDPPFLVMELVAGHTLAEELDQRRAAGEPLAAHELTPLLEDLAAALDYAHERKVLHRDIKPSNIMLDPSSPGRVRAKLLDFGIAAELRVLSARQSTDAMGTMAYMSPEQAAGQPLDARADVYALAATLYEAMTLALPWPAESAPAGRAASPPAGVVPEVAAVVLAGVSADAAGRPASAGALAAQFRTALTGKGGDPNAPWKPLFDRARRQDLAAPRSTIPGAVFCPLCSHANPPGARACALCSEDIETSEWARPAEGAPVAAPVVAPASAPAATSGAAFVALLVVVLAVVGGLALRGGGEGGGGEAAAPEIGGVRAPPPPATGSARTREDWERYSAVLASNPRNGKTAVLLGELALDARQGAFAAHLGRLAAKVGQPEAAHLEARASMLLDKWKEALPLEEKAAQDQPSDARVWYGLSLARRENGDTQGADAALAKASALDLAAAEKQRLDALRAAPAP